MEYDRKDKFREYSGILFEYKYPFSWDKRNKNYLEILSERDYEEEQDYMFPINNEDWCNNGE